MKKVTFANVLSTMDRPEFTNVDLGDGLSVGVRYRLGFKEVVKFIGDVVESVYNEDTHEYHPEIEDFTIRVCTMIYYAGFAAPKAYDTAYRVVYESGAYEKILAVLDKTQLCEITRVIREQIKFKRDLACATAEHEVVRLLGNMNTMFENIGVLNDDNFKETIGAIYQKLAKQETSLDDVKEVLSVVQ